MRRRWVNATDAAVRVLEGRWGARRLRVEECHLVLRAEHTYRELRRSGALLCPGLRTRAEVPAGRLGPLTVDLDLVENAVWRAGRLFYRCDGCGKRASRLYVPADGYALRCRTCWGLSYESRRRGYRATGLSALLKAACPGQD